MAEEASDTEIERLRTEVAQRRQQELDGLRQQLSDALADAAHYKSEANRNAEIGRQIASEAQQTIAGLRTQLSDKRAEETYARRQSLTRR